MSNKKEIIEHCRILLVEKLGELKNQVNELMQDAESDSKSSAGDKHETARAMMQLEQEKLNRQISEFQKQEEALNNIRTDVENDEVRLGSLVKTDKGTILIAIPLGKVTITDESCMVVSPISPIGQALMGLKVKSKMEINGNSFKILSIA